MAKAIVPFLFIVLVAPRLAPASSLIGAVVDPEQRFVAGAEVKLKCGEHTERTFSDTQGQFAFAARPTFEHCSLSVSQPGFAMFEKSLNKNPMPITVSLQLAATTQGVTVQSKVQDLRQVLQTSEGSTSLSDKDLKGISNNTADLIRYAKAVAGADASQDAIYVDGLPSTTLPPVAMVGHIDVNGDAFSPEYSDDDRTHINITTKSADRHFRLNFGGSGVGAGGNNPLAPNLPAVTHSADVNLTGPVPFTRMSFSLHGSLGSSTDDQPIEAILPSGFASPTAQQSAAIASHNGSGLLNLHYAAGESSQLDFSYSQNQSTGSNVGVGGLTLPESGSSSQSQSREARFTFTRAGASYLYRGGLVLNDRDSGLQANSTSLGITVPGSFVAGGAAISSSRSQHTTWTWKNVVQSESKHHFWTAGVMVTRSGFADDERPNSYGVFEFPTLQDYSNALAGPTADTWFITRGNGQAHYATVEAAPFVQGDLFRTQNLLVVGGVRLDYQSRGGVLASPRLSAAARAQNFTFRAGGGKFVHNWPGSVMLRMIEDDGQHLQPYIFQNAPIGEASTLVPSGALPAGPVVVAQISPEVTRPRDWMLKGSVERPFGHFIPGLEYTWTDGQHLLGSQRLPDPAGWLDVLESNRDRRRQSLHARVRYTRGRQSFTAHYEWVHSRDDTDGPFSFPENQADLGAEWARTAGQPSRSVTLVDSVRLPRETFFTLIATDRGSAPYNITTGLDIGDGLYNDRGGRPRNSGDGPGYRSLDVFGSHRFAVPGTAGKSGGRMYVSVGVQGQNLLGDKNYLGFDPVASSPLFGKPLAAAPGPSVRFWINFD